MLDLSRELISKPIGTTEGLELGDVVYLGNSTPGARKRWIPFVVAVTVGSGSRVLLVSKRGSKDRRHMDPSLLTDVSVGSKLRCARLRRSGFGRALNLIVKLKKV